MDAKLVACLVAQYRQGRTDVQHALWAEVSGSLAGWIHKKYGELQYADVQAVTCEAFSAALLKPEQFEDRAAFFTWLCGIAGNIARDYLREADSRKDDLSVESVPERVYYHKAKRRDPRSVEDELLELLKAAWIVLTPEQSRVVVGRLRCGHSSKRMAIEMDKSVAAVDMLFRRGMELVQRVHRIRTNGLDLVSSWESDLECTH